MKSELIKPIQGLFFSQLLLEGCCTHSFISAVQHQHVPLRIVLVEASEVLTQGTRLLQTSCKAVMNTAPGTACFWVQCVNRALTRTLITRCRCCSRQRNSAWQNTIVRRGKAFGMNRCVCDLYKCHLHPGCEGSTSPPPCSWLSRSPRCHQAHPRMMVQ